VVTVSRGGKGVNGKREGAEKQGYRKLEAGDRKDKDTGNWRLETGDWENLKGVNGERSTVNGRGRKSKDTGNWRLETGRTRILETGGWRQETGKTLKA